MIIIVGVGGWVLYFVVGVHTLLPTMLIIDRVDKGDDNLKQKAPLYFLFRNVLLKILYNFISYGINLDSYPSSSNVAVEEGAVPMDFWGAAFMIDIS